ncbi:MAG: Ig-like domain-containing protein, partial [Bacilli bacterium]
MKNINKKSLIGIIIAFFTIGFMVTSCSNNEDSIKGISVFNGDNEYELGNTYTDIGINSLSVLANYSNDKEITLPYDKTGEKGYSLTAKNSKDKLVDLTLPFEEDALGTVYITASYKDFSMSYNISVKDPYIDITSISFSSSTIRLSLEDTYYKLEPTILPSDATNKTLSYVSTDNSVVTVTDKGILSAKGVGECDINVSCEDNVSTVIHIVVADSGAGYSKVDVKYTSKAYCSDYAPTLGEQKLLFVPVHLSGTPSYKWTEEELENVNSNTEDIHDYYKNASCGAIDLTGTVCGSLDNMYQAPYEETELQPNSSEAKDKLYNSFKTALTWIKTNTDINLDDYDTDDDGYIDSIHFIFDGSDAQIWGGTLWPHMDFASLGRGTKENPSINCYSTTNLHHLGDAYTTIHEQGHIFGLEDYYDYSSEDKTLHNLGSFDMQDYGMFDWNSFSKMSVGWASPYVLDGSKDHVSITIKPASLTNDCILLAYPGSWNGTAFDEYILIELFSNYGNNSIWWDKYSKYYNDGGIRLYHVDARLWGYTGDDVNSGNYVDDYRYSNFKYFYIGANNSSTDSYAMPRPDLIKDNYYLIQIIQKSNVNTL